MIELAEAKQMAKDAGLDLVEVSPNSTPPVCRIMDYGKWKYQQRKKEQKARTNSKQSELKELRLRPKIDKHDLDIKMGKAKSFLEEGHKVQFTMLFRGREMVYRERGMNAMADIRDQLEEISKVETMPRMMGRRMTMVLAPDRTDKQPEKKAAKPAADKPAAEKPAAAETPAPAPRAEAG